jgi:hypothetical protein
MPTRRVAVHHRERADADVLLGAFGNLGRRAPRRAALPFLDDPRIARAGRRPLAFDRATSKRVAIDPGGVVLAFGNGEAACTSSRRGRTMSSRSTSPSPARRQMDLRAQPGGAAKGVACCGPVNRGAFYSDGGCSEPARRPHGRGRRRDRQGSLAHQARRHPEGRDHDDGAAGRRRQSAGRQFGRRDGRARLARRARCGSGKLAWKATAPAPTRTC